MRFDFIGTIASTALLLPPLLIPLWTAGCVEQLPPARTPDRVVPPVSAAAPLAEGQGRLVIDVVDGPTQIHRVIMESRMIKADTGRETAQFSESYTQLCNATPCVVDLTPGNVLLGFPVLGDSNDLELELVHISAEPTVYRRALSHASGGGGGFVLGIIGTTFGGMSMVTGMVFLPIGLATESDGFTMAGAITLGVGSVLTAVSIFAMLADPRSYRSGSSIHFPLAPEPAPEPATANQ